MLVFESFFKLTLCLISFIELSTGRVTFGNGDLFFLSHFCFKIFTVQIFQTVVSQMIWHDVRFRFSQYLKTGLFPSGYKSTRSTFTGVIGWKIYHKNTSIKNLLLPMLQKCYYQWIFSITVHFFVISGFVSSISVLIDTFHFAAMQLAEKWWTPFLI